MDVLVVDEQGQLQIAAYVGNAHDAVAARVRRRTAGARVDGARALQRQALRAVVTGRQCEDDRRQPLEAEFGGQPGDRRGDVGQASAGFAREAVVHHVVHVDRERTHGLERADAAAHGEVLQPAFHRFSIDVCLLSARVRDTGDLRLGVMLRHPERERAPATAQLEDAVPVLQVLFHGRRI